MPEISKSDYEHPRTAIELDAWRKAVHAAFKSTNEGKNAVRLRNRPNIKEYCDELWPLCTYAMRSFPERDDLLLCPELGNQNYDALIKRRDDPDNRIYVEITQAHDKESGLQDRLQREHLAEFGHSPQTARLSRPKGARGVIHSESGDFISLDAALEKSLQRIKLSIARKYKLTYPQPIILIVEFSELHFQRESDIDRLADLCRYSFTEIQDKFIQLALVSDRQRICQCFPTKFAWPT